MRSLLVRINVLTSEAGKQPSHRLFILLLLMGLCFFSSNPWLYAAEIKVALFQKDLPRRLMVCADSGLVIRDPQTKKLLAETQPNLWLRIEKNHSQIVLEISQPTGQTINLPAGLLEAKDHHSLLWIGQPGLDQPRPYVGTLEIRGEKDWLLAVNCLPADDYLAAVVSSEMPPDWPLEALKAQAVVTRTYLAKHLGRHAQAGFDFCDLAHCQVYLGQQKLTSAVLLATAETAKQILTFQQAPIDACYHSCCGGHTINSQEIWPSSQRQPYLQGQPDQGQHSDYCSASPDYHWTTLVENSQLAILYPGVQKLAIDSSNPSGRVARLALYFADQQQLISAEEFYLAWGRKFGWHQVKSNWYEIAASRSGYVLKGRGLGHGVGLCQWGARGRALAGYTYREILKHYFPGAEL